MGRPGHVHRGGTQVPDLRLLRVLHRRGPGHRRASPLRPCDAAEGGPALPHDPDLRRGEARGLLGSLLPRGVRLDGERDQRAARRAPLRRERRLEDDVRRHPPRGGRAAAQGPGRFPLAGARRHRVHGRDRGDARADRGAVHDQVAEGATTGSPASSRASPRSTATSRGTSASASSSWPTRSRTTRRTRGSSRKRSRSACRSRRSSSSRRGSTTRTTSTRPSTTRRRSSSTPRSRSRRSSPRWGSTRRCWPPLERGGHTAGPPGPALERRA